MSEQNHSSRCTESWHRVLGALCVVSLTACSDTPPGDSPGSVQSKIVGGVVPAPTGGAFVAALFQDFDGELDHICGGTFLAEDVVVTAAHCSFGVLAELEEQNQVVVGPTDPASVRVARRPASIANVSASDLLEVESVYVHPSYDPVSRDNDIAVWKLATASPGPSLELASVKKTTLVEDNRDIVRTFGYGSTAPGSSQKSDALMRAYVPAVPPAECRTLMYDALGGEGQPRLPEEIVTENMVCAGRVDRGSCVGDDGGPLAINQILVGITSWGVGCGSAEPYVYTKAGRYRKWINGCTGTGCEHLTESTTCVDGFTDCDGDPANGCETAGSDCDGGCDGAECNCDVISPNGPASGYEACGAGATCLPVFESPTTAPTSVCAAAGPNGLGQSCLVDGEPDPLACAAGLTCEFGECLAWCDRAAPACPGGVPCVAYPFPKGKSVTGRDLGVCFDGVIFDEDFAEYDDGWASWDNVRPMISFVPYFADEDEDGYYSIILWEGPFTASTGYEGRYPKHNHIHQVVEVDMWAEEFARLDKKAIGIGFQGFAAMLRLDGAIKISHYQGSETGWVPSDAILAPPARNHVRIHALGTTPPRFSLYVNGEHIAETVGVASSVQVGSPYFVVQTMFSGMADTLFGKFTNLFVRRATDAEVASWLGD